MYCNHRKIGFIFVLIFCLTFLFSACGKPDAAPEPNASASASAAATETPAASASASPTASDAPTSSPSAMPKENKTEEIPPTEETAVPAPKEEKEEKAANVPDAPICTLIVRCDEVFSHLEKLDSAKQAILPQDGIFCSEKNVTFSEGENAFQILQRELKKKKIPMEFVSTPAFHSVYIEGIGNLYEFDCGDRSGWLYRINGESLNYGSSQYTVQNGDTIEFYYSCGLGG